MCCFGGIREKVELPFGEPVEIRRFRFPWGNSYPISEGAQKIRETYIHSDASGNPKKYTMIHTTQCSDQEIEQQAADEAFAATLITIFKVCMIILTISALITAGILVQHHFKFIK